MQAPVPVTVEEVLNEPEYKTPLTNKQKALRKKNKLAKASRKKNRN